MYYIVSAFDKSCKDEEGILQKIRGGCPLFQDRRNDASEIIRFDKVSIPLQMALTSVYLSGGQDPVQDWLPRLAHAAERVSPEARPAARLSLQEVGEGRIRHF